MALRFRMAAILLRASSWPRFGFEGIPNPGSPWPYDDQCFQFLPWLPADPDFDERCHRNLRAISFRCQFSNVSGVAIVATFSSSFRPSSVALTARPRRWSSVKLRRRLPNSARSTRFSRQGRTMASPSMS
ncbi:MAG: hypothetical protein QOJ99_5631 [Bryobacterales bacterium]|nr:hypothetical protein [Bryobacterales bacterium]